jgi:hypothetical protein
VSEAIAPGDLEVAGSWSFERERHAAVRVNARALRTGHVGGRGHSVIIR